MIPLFRRFRVPPLRSRALSALTPVASAGCGANLPRLEKSSGRRCYAQLFVDAHEPAALMLQIRAS